MERYFWVKSDGSFQELSWEKYQRLALRNLRSKGRFYLLVIIIGNEIIFFKRHSVSMKLSILEQILQRLKEHEERPKEAGY